MKPDYNHYTAEGAIQHKQLMTQYQLYVLSVSGEQKVKCESG